MVGYLLFKGKVKKLDNKEAVTNTSNTVQTNLPKDYKVSFIISETEMTPVQVDVQKDKTVTITNGTNEEMTISLSGVINIDKIIVPAGKSVGGPVFGRVGELSVINLKNNKKLGTIYIR